MIMQTGFVNQDPVRRPENSMLQRSVIGLVVFAALLGTLTGCVAHVDGPHHTRAHAPPPTVYVVQDDYVYYPGYEVYYSSNRRQYTYRDGGSWVSRPTPQ